MDLFNLKLLKESASAVVIEAFQFDEDATIVETLTEADAMLSDMSADIDTNHTAAAEIVMEAYITGSANVLPISELSLKGIGRSVKEFYDKLVAIIKGIIEKIKQRFALATRNRSEFVARFNEAYGKRTDKTGSKFTYTGYKWNVDYLKSENAVSSITKTAEELTKPLSATAAELKTVKRASGPDDLATKMKKLKAEMNGIMDKSFEYNKIVIKLKGTPTDLSAGITKAARPSEKVTLKVSDIGITTMLNYIENSKSEAEKLTEGYNKLKETFEELSNAFDELDKSEFDLEFYHKPDGTKTENAMSTEDKAKAVEAQKFFKEVVALSKETSNMALGFFNRIVKTHQGLSEQAAREFMSTLRSFVLSKDDKK